MKKIIVFMLSFMIICTGAVFAEASEKQETSRCAEFDLLTELGIAERTYWRGETAAKGAFLRAVANLCGYDKDSSEAYTAEGINGIVPGDDLSRAVGFCIANGIIEKPSSLSADEPLKAEWAAEVLTNALGGRPVAAVKGGYYFVTEYKRLLAGHPINEPLSANAAAKMIYKAMKQRIYSPASYGGDGVITYNYGDTLLYEARKIDTVCGIVEATPYATLTGTYTSEGRIKIGSEIYRADNVRFMELIGRNVEAYFDEDEKILAIYLNDENEEALIDAEDITRFSNKSISYNDGKRTKTENFSNPTIIYNGRNILGSQFDDMLFDIEEGYVKLIKADSARYNLIIIYSVQNIIVGEVDIENCAVYDKFNPLKKIIVDAENYPAHKLEGVNGKPLSLSDISDGNVLSVAESIDGKCVYAVVVQKNIKGTVETVNDEKITIDGNEYEMTETAIKQAPELNREYVFYIGASGRIVYIENLRGTGNKAFLVYAEESRQTADKKVSIKFVTPDTDFEDKSSFPVVECADKVTVDGVKGLKGKEIMNALENYGSGKLIQMPFMYSLNSEGKIKAIDTPYYNEALEDEKSLRCVYDASLGKLDSSSMSRAGYGYSWKGRWVSRSDALMVKPKSKDSLSSEIESFTSLSRLEYTVSLFSAEGIDSRFVDFVVFDPSAAVSYAYPFIVSAVTDISQIYYNDEIVTRLVLYDEGTVNEIIVKDKDKDIISTLGKGDLIRYYADSKNRLVSYTRFYDCKEKAYVGPNSNYGAQFRPMFGHAEKIIEGWLEIKPENNTNDYSEIHYLKTGRLFLCTKKGSKIMVEKITADEIKTREFYGNECDTIYMYTYEDGLPIVYILRYE